MKKKQRINIVFCVDITSSMDNCITQLEKGISLFFETIQISEEVEWKARVIGYRDFFQDKEYLLNDFPFTASEDELRQQFLSLESRGGGDEPESTLDALAFSALKTNWEKDSKKIVILFTDASPLPNFAYSTTKEFGLQKLEELVENIEKNSVYLYMFSPHHTIYDKLGESGNIFPTQIYNPGPGLKNVDVNKLLKNTAAAIEKLS